MTEDNKWYFREGNDDIEIALEPWGWHVVYKDGTELFQFDRQPDATGKRRFHQFKEIDQSRVAVFDMINTENPRLRHGIDFTKEMSHIFHFYKRSRLEVGTDSEKLITFWCFGYQLKDTKMTVIDPDTGKEKVVPISVYHFIMPDNRMVITTDRNIRLIGQ